MANNGARAVRARDLGIPFPGVTGRWNAITDVAGVRVGHTTLIEGRGPLEVGQGPVRTGVTVIVPHGEPLWERPVFAGSHRLNGNGEMTGLEWLRESGMLTSIIGLTNTHSVGVVRDALIGWEVAQRDSRELFWRLPVVAETWDGVLNDINGQHVRREHLLAALDAASEGPVAEGSVGSGTGMICHGFKGGIGTASRLVKVRDSTYVVGVLVQANHGARKRFSILGVPIGELLTTPGVSLRADSLKEGAGSIIGLVATDAPMIPTQLDAMAQRVGLGVARNGGLGEHSSGDLFLAFSTANSSLQPCEVGTSGQPVSQFEMLSHDYLDPFYGAVVEATEEAIVNALVAAETMVGRDGFVAHRLPHEPVAELMTKWGRGV
jgi:D-aminopeptidase